MSAAGRLARIAGLAGAALVAATPALAKTVALLVGVSAYPKESVGDLQLTGPKFDVALMVETLRGLSVADEDTIVLADGLAETWIDRRSDGEPTRAAILGALDRLAGMAKAGDTALIYLSGHGSQAPELAPEAKAIPEPDGLDEIFLPIDIGKWDDTVGAVENALVDDELGRAVERIRAAGAAVLLVVDACHSGTLTRGAGEDGQQAKKVEPGALGIPAARIAAAKARAPTLRSGGGAAAPREGGFGAPPAVKAGEGGYVAFYAAHPDQLALQRNMPKSFAKDVVRRPHGILTYNLVQALRSGRAATYRDLAFAVMSGYQTWGVQAPVPLFEGDLALPVLGRVETGPRRFPLRVEGAAARLEGGLVDGVEPGAVYALARADDPKAAVIGHVRVTGASTATATVEPVERDGVAAPDLAQAARGRLLVATLIEPGVGLTYTVARPRLATEARGAAANLAAAVETLAGRAAVGVAFVAADEPADLGLVVAGDRLFLSIDAQPPVTEGREQTPSVPLALFADAAKAPDRLAQLVGSLAKARNLIRIADKVADEAVAGALAIDAFLHREPAGAPPAGAKAPDDRACAPLQTERVPEGSVRFDDLRPDGLDLVDLGHCDTAYFVLANKGEKPIDVTPLYVDGAGGIAYMGPPEGLRLEPRSKPRIVPVRVVTWSQKRGVPLPVGLERLLFVAVAQDDRAAVPADFRYLAQAAVTQTANRGGGASPFRSLLESAAFGTGPTRSASVGGVGQAGVVQFRWRVRPPAPEAQ